MKNNKLNKFFYIIKKFKMTSFQGTFQVFDDTSFLSIQGKPIKETYKENTIISFLIKNHPKFAYIIQRAQWDWKLSDTNSKFTLFVPLEESISDDFLLTIDINTAINILKRHLMDGIFPKRVLETSIFQELQMKRGINELYLQNNQFIINNYIKIIYMDIKLQNGFIHIIDSLLF